MCCDAMTRSSGSGHGRTVHREHLLPPSISAVVEFGDDDIDGTAHTAFGQLPNMTSILGLGNRGVFRSDWTDPDITRHAIADLLLGALTGGKTPLSAETEGSRWVNSATFTAGLQRNVQRAVEEFAAVQARWARGEHLSNLLRGQRRAREGSAYRSELRRE